MTIATDPHHAIRRMPPRQRAFLFHITRDDGLLLSPALAEYFSIRLSYHIESLDQAVVVFEGSAASPIPGHAMLNAPFPAWWGGLDWIDAGREEMIFPAYVLSFTHVEQPGCYRLLMDLDNLFSEISATWAVDQAALAPNRFLLDTYGSDTRRTYFRRAWIVAQWGLEQDWVLFSNHRVTHTIPYWKESSSSIDNGVLETFTRQVFSSIPHAAGISFSITRPMGLYLAKKWFLTWSYNPTTQRWSYSFSQSAWLQGCRDDQNLPHPDIYSASTGYVGRVKWDTALTPPPATPEEAGVVEYNDLPVCVGGQNMSLELRSNFGYEGTVPYQSSGYTASFQSPTTLPPTEHPTQTPHSHHLYVELKGAMPTVIYHTSSEQLDLLRLDDGCLSIALYGVPLAEESP